MLNDLRAILMAVNKFCQEHPVGDFAWGFILWSWLVRMFLMVCLGLIKQSLVCFPSGYGLPWIFLRTNEYN